MFNNFFILDKDHNVVNPTSEKELLEWFNNFNNRVVKKSFVNDVEISTVFLMLPIGDDEIFETMIFGGERDEEYFRYKTYEEAIQGHDKIVESFRERCSYCTCLRTANEKFCTQCGGLF